MLVQGAWSALGREDDATEGTSEANCDFNFNLDDSSLPSVLPSIPITSAVSELLSEGVFDVVSEVLSEVVFEVVSAVPLSSLSSSL